VFYTHILIIIKIKKMKKIFLFIAVLGVLASCDDELTIFPEDSLSSDTFFKTEADFEQAVNGAYVPLRNIVNSRAWLLGEMHSDNTYYARNVLFGATEQQEDIADFAIPSDNGVTTNTHVTNQYILDYRIIARTNQILATIDEVELDAGVKANLKGQALFLRGYAYFELVRYFGSAPLHLVPVTTREEAALPLASSEALYTQIIADVQEAAQLLPVKSQQDPGRVTSGAARTLLANVYMVQKNWAQAETLLRAVVQSNEYSLMADYADAFSGNTDNKNNAESVFEVQFKEGPEGLNGSFIYSFMPRPITAEEVETLTGTANAQPVNGEGNNIPTPDIIAAYEAGDLRKNASIDSITLSGGFWKDGTYPIIKKFRDDHSLHNNHGMNWPVYRYSEVLLFLAEALNEQGDADAATYLNMVRTRAGLGAATGDLGVAIFNERRVELAFENKRWFDLVRTDRALSVITDYGNRIKATPSDYYYPDGAAPRGNAFSNISLLYALPAAEADLSPEF
jgi:hypothetical protein